MSLAKGTLQPGSRFLSTAEGLGLGSGFVLLDNYRDEDQRSHSPGFLDMARVSSLPRPGTTYALTRISVPTPRT